MITKWILVFFAMMITDAMWTIYSQGIRDHLKEKASLASGAIIAFGGLTTISYTHERILLIPAILGAIAGTYLTMTFHKPKIKS